MIETQVATPNIFFDYMKITDLEPRLLAAGCNRNAFAIGAQGSANDAFCLVKQNGRWEVFYTERGCDSPPMFTSNSETEACDFFYKYIIAKEHMHLVGWFVDEADAVALEARIQNLGIKPRRNDINYHGFKVDTYRVFVVGKDIFPVLKAIPEIAIVKDPNASQFLKNLRYAEFKNISPAEE